MLGARQSSDSLPPRAARAPLSDAAAPRAGGDRWLACKACGGFVALIRARLSVSGAEQHSFINPQGSMFRIGCFVEAPGLRPWGEESSHWTWFVGFLWQAGVCARCGAHLGWSYRNASQRFVALILDRVVERSDSAPQI